MSESRKPCSVLARLCSVVPQPQNCNSRLSHPTPGGYKTLCLGSKVFHMRGLSWFGFEVRAKLTFLTRASLLAAPRHVIHPERSHGHANWRDDGGRPVPGAKRSDAWCASLQLLSCCELATSNMRLHERNLGQPFASALTAGGPHSPQTS